MTSPADRVPRPTVVTGAAARRQRFGIRHAGPARPAAEPALHEVEPAAVHGDLSKGASRAASERSSSALAPAEAASRFIAGRSPLSFTNSTRLPPVRRRQTSALARLGRSVRGTTRRWPVGLSGQVRASDHANGAEARPGAEFGVAGRKP
jgi:hypothetical protein